MKKLDLLKDDPKKLFFSYLLPSISATLVTSIYVLADTIIIGKGIGPSAIATLNLILPMFTLLFGTGLLLGVGGAVLMSVANGQKDKELANTYFTHSVIGGIFIALIYMLVGNLFFIQIAHLLGSDASNIDLFRSYAKYLIGFSPVFVFSSLLQAFVRNDGAPKRAMIAVISGGVLNVVLDCVFIFKLNMGMAGGAIATVIGSVASVIILLTHFMTKQNTMKFLRKPINFTVMRKILHSGLPSFLIEIASGIIILIFNLQLLKYVGELGIVVYSIIANSAIIAMSLFNGVSQGAQPIMAINYGAQQMDRVVKVRRLGGVTAFIIAGVIFALGAFFPEITVAIFIKPTKEVTQMASPAIKIYFTAFFMMSLNIFYSTYFQSILKPKASMIICVLRGIILSVGLVFILPIFWGVTGIWLVMPITELITLGVAVLLVKKVK